MSTAGVAAAAERIAVSRFTPAEKSKMKQRELRLYTIWVLRVRVRRDIVEAVTNCPTRRLNFRATGDAAMYVHALRSALAAASPHAHSPHNIPAHTLASDVPPCRDVNQSTGDCRIFKLISSSTGLSTDGTRRSRRIFSLHTAGPRDASNHRNLNPNASRGRGRPTLS